MKYIATINAEEFVIEIDHDYEISVNGERYQIDFQNLPEAGMLSLLLENRSLEAVVEERDDVWEVLMRGELYTVQVQDERAYRLAKARGTAVANAGEAEIRSPMPGLIVAVPVKEGAKVQQGDKVIILESMKMENELRSPIDGVVSRITVTQGAGVEKDQVLAVITAPESDEEEA